MPKSQNAREHWYDRYLDAESANYLAAILTIVGALSSAFFSLYLVFRLIEGNPANEKASTELLLAPTILSLVLLIILTFVSLSYRRKLVRIGRQSAAIARLDEQAKTADLSNCEVAKYLTLIAHAHYYFCDDLLGQIKSPDIKTLDSGFQIYLDTILDNTAKLFTVYTGDQSAACIKIFSREVGGTPTLPTDDEPQSEYVSTLRRDPASREFRRSVDKTKDCSTYKYQDNAAFFYIIDRSEHPDHFIENNLSALVESNQYWNKHQGWQKQYNATAVVPIKRPDRDAQQQTMAMLCVDNRIGGFDSGRCLYLLQGIAVDLYYGVRTYLVLADQIRKGNPQ